MPLPLLPYTPSLLSLSPNTPIEVSLSPITPTSYLLRRNCTYTTDALAMHTMTLAVAVAIHTMVVVAVAIHTIPAVAVANCTYTTDALAMHTMTLAVAVAIHTMVVVAVAIHTIPAVAVANHTEASCSVTVGQTHHSLRHRQLRLRVTFKLSSFQQTGFNELCIFHKVELWKCNYLRCALPLYTMTCKVSVRTEYFDLLPFTNFVSCYCDHYYC